MDRDLKVSVVEFSDRRHYQMQFRDPITGRKRTRSTGIERTGRKRERTEAERVAAKWEADLREGRYSSPSKSTWADFRQRYEDEVLPGLASGTEEKVTTVFNLVETILNPQRLRDLTADRLSHFKAELRKGTNAREPGKAKSHKRQPGKRAAEPQPAGRSETTVASYLAHLMAALRWAVRVEILTKVPKVDKIRRAKSSNVMKGRPVTAEEFERMLGKVPEEFGPIRAPHWIRLLNGLWLSGLRLSEALDLTWDDDGHLSIDLTGKFPMLRIPAEREKGNKDRLLPITPDFAEFLLETPREERSGFVFHTPDSRGRRIGRRDEVGRRISILGEKAGVKVNTDARGRIKFASAHDLRRSFGERWASRVMPQVLMELMRHESIETTLRFYVGRNAQTTAAVLWEAHKKATESNSTETGNTLGNSRNFGSHAR
jgi:integrase